jgi:hypothetical protein
VWCWLDDLESLDTTLWMEKVREHPRPSPFLTPMFLRPWARHFAGPLKLGLGNHGQSWLLLHRGPRFWELLGGEEVADRLDLLGSPAGLAPSLREEIRQWDAPVSFPNLAPDAWALQLIAPEDLLEEVEQSPFLPLAGSFESYLQSLTKKQRHELLRKRRRAERLASSGLRISQGLADLEVFLDLHRRSSPHKADFMHGSMEAFFRSLALSLDQQGMLWLVTLWDGSVPLASLFHIRFAGVVHLYNSGYAPEAAALAPGVVLLSHCIELSCASGFCEYDFLRGTERYKYDLGGRDRAVFRLRLGAACDTCC